MTGVPYCFFEIFRDDPDQGPVSRCLSDPSGFERELWLRFRTVLSPLATIAGSVVPALAAVLILCWIIARVYHARRWRRALRSSHWVEIEPPERSETANGQEMWRQLLGLLMPRSGASTRVLGWELHARGDQVVGGVWVPGSFNAQQAARCVSAAYRRSRPRVRDVPSVHEGGREAAGFAVVPRTSMWQPLLAEMHGGGRMTSFRGIGPGASWVPDQLDGLWQALSPTSPAYAATVQVLVRPLQRRTRATAQAVRSADGDRSGRSLGTVVADGLAGLLMNLLIGVLGAVVDVVAPGPSAPRSSGHGSDRASRTAVDPVTAQERRIAAVKARAELVEACVRVVVSGPDRRMCREQAWLAANSLRAVVTAQPLDVVRLGSPEKRVTARSLRHGVRLRARGAGHRKGWFVVTDAELGALARLPYRPALYRFEIAGAPHLPVPAGVPRLGTEQVGR